MTDKQQPRARERSKWYKVQLDETADGAGVSEALLNNEIKNAKDGLSKLAEQIGEIDSAIREVAKALRISQPPVEGKIDIRWWVIGTRRVPVFVRWEKIGQRLSPVLKKRIHLETNIDLSKRPNHEATKLLVEQGRRLIKARSNVTEKLANINRVLTATSAQTPHYIQEASNAKALRHECADRLVQLGYTLTEDAYS